MNRLAKLFEDNRPETEMSADEMRTMMAILMSKEPAFNTPVDDLDKESEIYKHFKPVLDGIQMQIFLTRLKHVAKMRITLGAFIMIAEHLESAGTAVMYVYYIWLKLNAHTLITSTVLCEELFPWGFFSHEQLNKIWSAQKITKEDRQESLTPVMFKDSDNLIDFQQSWIKNNDYDYEATRSANTRNQIIDARFR
jgi:hypothetical protein